MTHSSAIAPTAIRRPRLPRLTDPRLRLGASLGAMIASLSDAYRAAYVDPYWSLRRGSQVAPGDELRDRDPSW